MNTNYDIIILSTACSRPDLHNQSFPSYLKFVEGLRVKWIVTVNTLYGSLEETKENIHMIADKYNVDVDIFGYDTGGTIRDWYNSVRKLIITACENYQPKIGYLWLEDDWKWNGTVPLTNLIANLPKENWYFDMFGRGWVSFNPGLWSVDAFKRICYDKQPAVEDIDVILAKWNPERMCTYDREKNHPGPVTNSVNVTVKKLFDEIGTSWQRKNLRKKFDGRGRTFLENE